MLKNYTHDILTPRETAKILRVSMNTMYKLLKENKIKSVKLGVKYIIKREDLIDFLNEN